MPRTDELYSLFTRNFPYITRAEETARALLADPLNHIVERRDPSGNLVAAVVLHKNNVLLLAVDAPHRRQGLGSALLNEAEAHARSQGYAELTVGAGDDYLCPGVPVREKPFAQTLLREDLDLRIPADNAAFFLKRGYTHSWGECNCFDMRMPMADCALTPLNIGDTDRGILYRWATEADLPGVCACTDDAEPNFTKYYVSGDFYRPDSPERVLVALDGSVIVGTLVVSREAESPGLGSIGCTAVRNAYQGRKIATNMIMLGAKSLHAAGMREGYLGYTYSGLDKLYGRAGYAVSTLYFMARKVL